MLRYNSNKPDTDKTPKQDRRTVAPVFSIMIDKETCECIVSTGGITSTKIGNQGSTANVHNTITNNNNEIGELQCFKCGNYEHKVVDCNNKLTCFACGRTGHLLKDCDTLKCTVCEKYGHSSSICWKAHPELKRGRGGGRSRGGSGRVIAEGGVLSGIVTRRWCSCCVCCGSGCGAARRRRRGSRRRNSAVVVSAVCMGIVTRWRGSCVGCGSRCTVASGRRGRRTCSRNSGIVESSVVIGIVTGWSSSCLC